MKIIVLIRDAFLFSSFDTKGDVGHQFVSVVHFSVHLTQKVMWAISLCLLYTFHI
jgi:hypothetical protein